MFITLKWHTKGYRWGGTIEYYPSVEDAKYCFDEMPINRFSIDNPIAVQLYDGNNSVHVKHISIALLKTLFDTCPDEWTSLESDKKDGPD